MSEAAAEPGWIGPAAGRYGESMASRRSAQPGTAIKVIAGTLVGFGCGVAMSELTDSQWWIRYPLILVAVFVVAEALEAIRNSRPRRTD